LGRGRETVGGGQERLMGGVLPKYFIYLYENVTMKFIKIKTHEKNKISIN
jgi:hypothetical protein